MSATPFEFRLADVGEGLHEAEIKRWLVQPGDRVTLDQDLVEIETDKAIVQIPAPVAGVVTRLGGNEGDILHVGELLALIEPDEAPAPAAGSPAPTPVPVMQTPVPAASAPPIPASGEPAARVLTTPAVRKLARDLGVDLTGVTPSGPGGRILAADVEAHGKRVPQSQAEPPRASSATNESASHAVESANRDPQSAIRDPEAAIRRVPLRGLRRRIARTMTQAWTTIPHITGFDEVDVSALVAARARLRPVAEARGQRLTYLPFVVKAVTVALREFPIVNASLDDAAGEIVYHGVARIGIATASPDGLLVPVLKDAAGLTLLELQAEIDRLAERARTRTATPEELHGGTFTITNFGALGGWQAAPIIRPGEAAILGVGRIQARPWVVEGQLAVRDVLALSVAADHRLIDGDISTAFLTRVGALLSAPELLMLEMA